MDLMKILFNILILSLLGFSNVNAGALFGPPPFTNGFPLPSGAKGTYQASAVGNGITGIIRFSYNSEQNPSALGYNDYIFFVNGTIVSGATQVAIMDNRISGVLNLPNTPTTPPTDGFFDSLGGFFNEKIQQNSSFYSFKGSGALLVYEALDQAPNITAVAKAFSVSGVRTSLNSAE
jgi:hypothetical protein